MPPVPNNKSHVIDLATDPDPPSDHLSRLPPELLHLIFDTLFPTHQPDIAFKDGAHRAKITHPLEHLSLTSHHLHEQVHGWAKSWLVAHQSITKYKDLKTTRLQQHRDHLRGRGGLLTWSERHCVFCGKLSARSAVLANGLRCCMKCDMIAWPGKITKIAAKAEYDLTDQHFSRGALGGWSSSGEELPRLHYGTYFSCGVPTTKFLRADVERLANAVHGGDLARYMSEKKAASEEKKRKKDEKEKRRKRASSLDIGFPPL